MSDPAARLNAALEGRYAIERELGQGGMATVYLAEDIKHERKVALKVLKPELAAVVGAKRFLAEIKTTASLQHPHILPLFDSGEAQGFLYYVMPFIDGETVREKLKREKQLGIDEAVRIATDVAGALDYAHRSDVIHRDIKPENILLHDGRAMVADFGIALAVGAAGGGRLTETGLSLGTPHYMSPEQATAEMTVTNRSDIYSLGAVLYEMFTGEPPHMGSSARQIIVRIVTEEAPPVTEQRPSIPANVDATIRKALEKLPADRFASAQDFARALGDEHFRYGKLATARASAASGPWNRLTIVMTALAAVLTLMLGTGWILFGRGIGTSEPPTSIEQSVAVMPCTYGSTAGDETPLTQGFAEGIINGLVKLPNLKVSGLNSVIELLAQNADIETIAERLDVATVLECSLQQVGEMVRVRPQLVEAATNTVLWSAEIDGRATDVFAIQDEVARAVTDQLQVVLALGEDTPLVAQATTVPEAHAAYIRGRHFWNQRTGESLRAAIEEFRVAIRLDDDYADAYSGLADSYSILPAYDSTARGDRRSWLELGVAAASRAVELDSRSGRARTSLAWALTRFGQWDDAEPEFEEALRLSPGWATAHQWYGLFLGQTGKLDEAVEESRQALYLDPVSKVVSQDVAQNLELAGRYAEAIEQALDAIGLDSTWNSGWGTLALARLGDGEHEAAIAANVRWAELSGYDTAAAREEFEVIIRYRETGEPTLHLLPEGATTGAWPAATFYTESGQRERALEAVETMLDEGNFEGLVTAHVRGTGDFLGDEPRYQAVLAAAGITW